MFGFTYSRQYRCWPIALCALILLSFTAVRAQRMKPLRAGWHDEMNATAVDDWSWQPSQGRADLSAPTFGMLRLTLGNKAQADQIGKDTYYWATCARNATVDLDRYPILAVRVLEIKGKGDTWWDVTVNDFRGGDVRGPDIGGKLASGKHPGLLFFDVTANGKLTGRQQIRIRLNVAGRERGAYADYAYVRFIQRRDRKRLLNSSDLQKIVP